MAKRIKATLIKSETLCENCEWFYYPIHHCSTLKHGERCRAFKRKGTCLRFTNNSFVFNDENGNMIFMFTNERKDK